MQTFKNNFILDERKSIKEKNSSEKEPMERFSLKKNEIK